MLIVVPKKHRGEKRTKGLAKSIGYHVLILIILCLPDLGVGQPADSTNIHRAHSLKDGAWALQFKLNNLFKLDDFQGATVSAKYHLADKRAVRLGIDISTYYEKNDDGLAYEDKSDIQRLKFNMQYIVYPSLRKNLYFFWGIGPSFSFARMHRKSEHAIPDLESTSQYLNAGLQAAIGAEWFATREISLTADYSTLAEYNWVTETTSWQDNVSKKNQFKLDSLPARFGLSVYF